jgi:hypothetical protein
MRGIEKIHENLIMEFLVYTLCPESDGSFQELKLSRVTAMNQEQKSAIRQLLQLVLEEEDLESVHE